MTDDCRHRDDAGDHHNFRDDHDGRAGACQGAGHGPPDAGAAAGHQGELSGKAEVHCALQPRTARGSGVRG